MESELIISPPRGCPDCLRPSCPFCGARGYGCPHVLASSSPHVSGGWDVSPFARALQTADDRAGELRLFAELLPVLDEPPVRVRHVKEKYLGLHQAGATYFAADPERARDRLAELLAARGIGRLG